MSLFPLSDPITWFKNQLVTAAKIKSQIIDPLNSLPRGFLAGQQSSTNVPLSDTANHTGSASVTITLTETRVLRIDVAATFNLASGTAGLYATQVAYNTGTTADVTTATLAGMASGCSTVTAGAAGRPTASANSNIGFAPGTYTFFPMVTRNTGSISDACITCRVAVTDVGAG